MMKLTVFFLAAFLLAANAKSFSQSVTFSGKNVTLKKVFEVIEEQTGYVVFYNEGIVHQAKPIDIHAKGELLDQFLKDCFVKQDLQYVIQGKTILVTKTLATPPESNAPSSLIDLHGRVADSVGRPLAGATVYVTGSNKVITTDEKGEFYLTGVNSNAMLVITHVGYERLEVKLKGKTEINVRLKVLAGLLGEVSISVSNGYQSIPKERATGSFGVITGEDLAKRPDLNLTERLEGMVSGVLVNVGATDRDLTLNHDQFMVRGLSTILSNQAPLIVLDGFPTELDLVNINPNDIEKITVLKDAAAASIWGVRAANGVIVIDTKRGKYNSAPVISFSSILKSTGRARLDAIPNANSTQVLNLEQELVNKGILPVPSSPLILANPALPEGSQLYIDYNNGQITQAQLNEAIDSLQRIDARQQYQKYIMRAPFSEQYNLSISAGGPSLRNYLSVSYADEYPSAIGNYDRRITVNFNNEVRLSSRLSATAEILLTLLNQRNNGIGIAGLLPGQNSLSPYDQIVGPDGQGTNFAFRFPQKTLDSLQNQGFLPWTYNYLDEMANADNTYQSWAYVLNTGLKYEFNPALNVQVKYMTEQSSSQNNMYYNSQTYMARNMINTYTDINTHVLGVPDGGILTSSPAQQNDYSLRGQINFAPNLGLNSRLDAAVGGEIRQTLATGSASQVYGYDNRLLTAGVVNYTQIYNTVSGSQTIPLVQTYTNLMNRYTSAFGNFTYTYKQRYSLSGSVRKDNSNLFGTSKQYHTVPLWSIGGLWRALPEPSGKSKWLSQLNLRTTYGYNGNVNTETSPLLVTQASPVNNPFNNLPFASVFDPANPYLRWEKVSTLNAAVDYGLFNNRVTGSLDLYWKKSTDLLGPVSIDPTYGFSSLLTNQLAMTNHGLDLEIAAMLISGKKFYWRATANFSYNTNEVTKAYFQQNTTTYYTTPGNPIAGKPLNSVYAYRFGGLDQNGTAMINTGKGKVAADLSNFDETDLSAIAYKGVGVAPYFGGMTQLFHFKNVELLTLFTYKFGDRFIRPTIDDYVNFPYDRNANEDVARRWEKPGDELKTDVPAVDPNHLGLFRYRSSDLFVENGGYVRWKELSLSYHIPGSVFKSAAIKGLNCSISGQNLAIWTVNKVGIDPDYIPNNSGLLPPSKSFIFSVKADF